MSRRSRRQQRSYTPFIAVGLVVVVALVGYYVVTQSGVGGASSPLIGTPVSSTILSDLSGVSSSTLSFIGPGAAGATTAAGSNSTAVLTLNGKPEVLYMGAEYCPYCAAERWAMIVALDKFGNFTGLEYMQSSSSDIYPNTYTFTFLHATYTSNYITFVSVETEDRAENTLQTPTSAQSALLNTYDTSGNIPFLDIANKYTLVGSQVGPPILRVNGSSTGAPYNWTQIGSQLNSPSSIFAQNIDGAANRLIAAICVVDGSQPKSLCSTSIEATASYVVHPSTGSQPLPSDAIAVGPEPRATEIRSASLRLITWV